MLNLSSWYATAFVYRFLNMEEGMPEWNRGSIEDESEVALNTFRRPRNFLMCIVSSFFNHSTARGRELRRLLSESSARITDLLDHKSHSVSFFYQ